MGFSQKVGRDDYIPESLYYMLGMKAGNERAITYQKWLAMEVLPSIRKTGTYNSNKPKCIEDVLIESLQEMKAVRNQLEKQDKEIAAVQSNVEGIREIVALNPNDWRKESSALINKMALNCGGYEHIKVIREESYKLL